MSGRAKGLVHLEPGQVGICFRCNDVLAEDFDAEAKCLNCGDGGYVVADLGARGRKSIARRWGEDVARCGFTATPNVLVEHWPALGVTPFDQRLLELLEFHRREKADAWPSLERLAEMAGGHSDHVRKRLRALRTDGLIEWTRERRRGRFEVNVYTRDGLSGVAERIAQNRRAGVEDLEAIDDLLAQLRHRASVPSGTTGPRCPVESGTTTGPTGPPPPGTQAQTTGPTDPTNQRKEEEAQETDSSSEASSPRDDGSHGDDGIDWDVEGSS